jgi:hypothetical protein
MARRPHAACDVILHGLQWSVSYVADMSALAAVEQMSWVEGFAI